MPAELRHRGHSISTHEVAQGSWVVGNMPRYRESTAEGLKSANRRSSLQLGFTDAAALRSMIRGGQPQSSVDIQAVAGGHWCTAINRHQCLAVNVHARVGSVEAAAFRSILGSGQYWFIDIGSQAVVGEHI